MTAPEPSSEPATENDLAAVEKLAEGYRKMTAELGKVIVGQKAVIEELMIALLSGGHCLLVGVPGLAKTLMVRTLADAMSLSFNRIQFTPDLMPADITGTEVIQEDKSTGAREFRFLEGPIFANVVLADEINRTPPKTQAALLEAMQEHQVTAGGKRHKLPDLFFVLATQNPIEQEGTYPLPEAQLDRFMFEILVDYPDEEEEFQIVRQTTAEIRHAVHEVLSIDDVAYLQSVVRRVPVADHVIRYAMQFPRLTRREKGNVPDFIQQFISWAQVQSQPIPGPGSQSPRDSPRPDLRQHRRHPRGGEARAKASHHHQLQRRSRRHQTRRHHRPPDQRNPRPQRNRPSEIHRQSAQDVRGRLEIGWHDHGFA